MYTRKITEDLECGINIAMKVFGGKWKPCILDAIHQGYTRPSEMHRQIEEATPRVIDIQLSELEKAGVVEKKVHTGFPLRTEYSLTEIGRSILPVLDMLNTWGMAHKETLKLTPGVSTEKPRQICQGF